MDALQIVAEPRRRQILAMVWDKELPVSAIASGFDVSMAAISQHLTVLREAGMVKMRKDGNRHLYTADRVSLEPFRSILETMWAATLRDLAATIESHEGDRDV